MIPRISYSVDFAMVASQAAIEAECYLKGKGVGFSAVGRLGKFIREYNYEDGVLERSFFQEALGIEADSASQYNTQMDSFLGEIDHVEMLSAEKMTNLRDAFNDLSLAACAESHSLVIDDDPYDLRTHLAA